MDPSTSYNLRTWSTKSQRTCSQKPNQRAERKDFYEWKTWETDWDWRYWQNPRKRSTNCWILGQSGFSRSRHRLVLQGPGEIPPSDRLDPAPITSKSMNFFGSGKVLNGVNCCRSCSRYALILCIWSIVFRQKVEWGIALAEICECVRIF